MDGEEAAHEGVNAAVIGIAARFQGRKEKASVGCYKTGIKRTDVPKTTIVGNDGVGFLRPVFPGERSSYRNGQLVGRKKWGLRVDVNVTRG